MAVCLAIAWVALTPPEVFPTGGSTSASATGMQDITITSDRFRVLNFGSILGPTDFTQTFTIETNGGLDAGDTGNGSFISGQREGRARVEGEPAEEFVISVLIPDGGVCSGIVSGSVTLTAILLNPLADVSSTVIGSGQRIDIGGVLKVDANSRGNGTCLYVITVSYSSM